ncbi:MAG: DUF4236 domain-containing protein [Cyclobacteriaceae bacterium]|nr:DUF4236 domain-containing protein [Cyclobacteriaceae bacterium]MCH8516101.1 DUF4236 domain-containing protein [Cyclobacteriaceae bacterium]
MPFYIRKSFGKGPLRINLSKSGLGFSLGVKGLRYGVNSKVSSYVHAGRGGLYYRKSIKNGASPSSLSSRASVRSQVVDKEIFIDTGLTYPSHQPLYKHEEDLHLPTIRLNNVKSSLYLILAIVSIFSVAMGVPFFPALGVSIVFFLMIVFENQKQKKQLDHLDHFLQTLENYPEQEQDVTLLRRSVPSFLKGTDLKAFYYRLVYQWFGGVARLVFPLNKTYELAIQLGLSEDELIEIKTYWYREILEHLSSDHQLTQEEVQHLDLLAQKWNIPNEVIQAERHYIRFMTELREQIDEKIDDNILQDKSYFYSGEGRVLQAVIQNSYQRDNLRYKEIGYKLDIEGALEINQRFIRLIQQNGDERKYTLNHLIDAELSIEDGTVRLFFKNRVSPLVLSMPDQLKFFTILQKVLESRKSKVER